MMGADNRTNSARIFLIFGISEIFADGMANRIDPHQTTPVGAF